MSPKAVDVHGFGGGFTLGAVQAGFELTGKMGRTAGFGVNNTLGNRALLGNKWESITHANPREWDRVEADVLIANPPCSGFSTLSPKSFRGLDSSINDMMWEVVEYASRVQPKIALFESVQQTFRQGLPLMRQLRNFLEEETGKPYWLYHVLHNNASVGGVADRKRYFWVASQVPFGVESCGVNPAGEFYDVDLVPTMGSALRDLEGLGLTLERQMYPTRDEVTDWEGNTVRIDIKHSSSWAQREVHDGTGGVDGHDILRSPTMVRAFDMVKDGKVVWAAGESLSDVARRYYAQEGRLPASWYYQTTKVTEAGIVKMSKVDRLIETDFAMGHNQPVRWHWDRLARVVTGGGCHLVIHPHQPRTLSQREVARIQGFPDAWKIWPVRNSPDLGPGWGKGVPVQAGRWVSRFARAALEGEPGSLTGVPLAQFNKRLFKEHGGEERESVIDITNDWKSKKMEILPGQEPGSLVGLP